MDDFENELKFGFLDEAKELLLNAEQCFLDLEKAKDDPAIIEQIFRLAHNLKGSAGAVGFNDLKDFTHKLESLLLKIKNREIAISSEIISLLLNCSDHISTTLELLRENPEARHDHPELSARIDAALEGRLPIESGATNEDGNDKIDHSETAATVEEAEAPAGGFEPRFEANSAAAGKPQAKPDENIRVNLSKIDLLLNIMGELVILQTVMDQHKQYAQSMLMHKTIRQMSKIIKEAQELSMGLRMVPLKQTFQKMQRIVRDTSRHLGKDVELVFSGEETELDKTVIEKLSDPLVHLIRNAVDHGVESPDERRQTGKPSSGVVHLKAYQKGGHIVIEIRDDGKGLDPKKLIKKGIEKGLIKEGTKLSDEDAYNLIFAPGFSTKEQVTDVSGRGVGMDVVKTNITLLKGSVGIESQLGAGTCFHITLPLTMAIIDGMVVTLDDQRYVIPISQIHESLKPKSEDLNSVNMKAEVLVLRGQALPFYRLEKLLRKDKSQAIPPSEGIALVCRDVNQRSFAVFVNDIINQQQIVIKSLGNEVKGVPGISGAAILGDGRAALILDLNELVSLQQVKNSSQQPLSQEAV